MVRSLLIRGMLVGILAGLLAFGFARVFGEPQVDAAIAFEESYSAQEEAKPAPAMSMNMSTAPAAGHDHGNDEELVSRPMQASFGLLTGVLVYGTALGGIFALVFAFAQGRLGSLSPRTTAAIVAAIGFAAVVIVPQLKYPANPPAVGNPDTIGMRTALYFTIMALSVLVMIAALNTANRLAASLGRWNANLIAAAAYAVVMAIAMMVLPGVHEVPAGFSADVLWNFRIASLGIHGVLWTTLGLVFGILAQKLMQPEGRRA
ncbi:membrane protein [Labrys miyagiensis]|uniref:Membrane protein n=1 Tax=Labrys miyagiensis TaxID=346912 RepID=A0ABQ6CD28_9HYPH|nr:CbtA family protein [Labrys miyagiensis]GLS17704.1 membrane protein [Labrys miyagiensis]